MYVNKIEIHQIFKQQRRENAFSRIFDKGLPSHGFMPERSLRQISRLLSRSVSLCRLPALF